MSTPSRFPFLLIAIGAFVIEGGVNAQVVNRVNVMPGYPNVPRIDPDQRRLVRPSEDLVLWGSANDGAGTANGSTYTWIVTPGADVQVTDDGSLTGPVGDDSYITEDVTFSLLNGATSGLATATLSVSDGVNTHEDMVEIAIIDSADPLSDTPLEDLQIDVNISIDDGLRYLYRNQYPNGSWDGSMTGIAPTGFSLWAMQNQGHLATNDSDEDILSERVQAGLDFLFNNCQVVSDVTAPNADVARGATANGKSDMNSNGQAVSFGPIFLGGGGDWGYEHPIATAALAASVSPTEIVGVGPAAGMTYAELGMDCLDMIGAGQVENMPWRGGWRYSPSDFSSDMSINSWHYVAMEGLYVTFGIDIPDWILQETETNLVFHQDNSIGAVPFGYDDINRLMNFAAGHATTGGGLSGLYAVELQGPHTSGGTIISLEPAPLDSITAKRDAALEYLGDYWGEEVPGGAFAEGNRGNSYAMWTVARALRLTAFAQGLPSGDVVTLNNMGTSFDWETGEENGSGVLAAPGSDREGYFSYLVRTQDTLSGGWNSYWGQDLDTAMAVLILTPKVFLVEPPDDGGGGDPEVELDDALFCGLDVDIRTSHVYGTIAAGNDLFVETCNLGLDVSPEDTDSMIANRDLYAHIGLLDHGNVVAGNSLNIEPTFGLAGGTLPPRIENVIDFSAVLAEVSSVTTTLGALTPTGTIMEHEDNLDLTAHNGADVEIFSITATQLEVARHVTIEVDPGSAALVNIEGGNLNPVQFGIELVGVTPDLVLFNAYEASQVFIADVNFDGSLVVQGGDVDIAEIDVAGQLVAGGNISIQTSTVWGQLFSGEIEDLLPYMGGHPMQEPEDVLLHNLVLSPSSTGTVMVSPLGGTDGSSLVVTVNGLTRHFRPEKIARLTLAGITDSSRVSVDPSLDLDVHYLEEAPLGGEDVYMLDQMDVPPRGRGMILMDLFANDLAGSSGLDPSSFRVVTAPEHGVVRHHEESGRIWLSWGSSKWLEDEFEYIVLDGNGVRSAPVRVRIVR